MAGEAQPTMRELPADDDKPTTRKVRNARLRGSVPKLRSVVRDTAYHLSMHAVHAHQHLVRHMELALFLLLTCYLVLFAIALVTESHLDELAVACGVLYTLCVAVFVAYFADNASPRTLRILLVSPKIWVIIGLLGLLVVIHFVQPSHPSLSPINGLAYATSVLGLLSSEVFVARHRNFWLSCGAMVALASVANIFALTVSGKDEGVVLVSWHGRSMQKRNVLRSIFATALILLLDGLYTLFTTRDQSTFYFIKGRTPRPTDLGVRPLSPRELHLHLWYQRVEFVLGAAGVALYLVYTTVYLEKDCDHCVPAWLKAATVTLFVLLCAAFAVDARRNMSPVVLRLLLRQPNLWLVLALVTTFIVINSTNPNEEFMSPLFGVGYFICLWLFIFADTFQFFNRNAVLSLSVLMMAISAFGVLENTVTDLDQGEVLVEFGHALFFKSDINRTIYFNVLVLTMEACVNVFRDKDRELLAFARSPNISRENRIRMVRRPPPNPQPILADDAVVPGLAHSSSHLQRSLNNLFGRVRASFARGGWHAGQDSSTSLQMSEIG